MTPRWAAAAAAVGVALGGCGGGGREATTGAPPTAAPSLRAVAALCAARAEAGGDVAAVRATFYDRAHDALHAVAAQLEPLDRALEARLLEATQAVEADLTARPPGAAIASDLDGLLAVTRQGLARLGLAAPRCR